jgi:hypothetical protein
VSIFQYERDSERCAGNPVSRMIYSAFIARRMTKPRVVHADFRVTRTRRAILAAAACLVVAFASRAVTTADDVDPPLPVRFRLTDGVRIEGRLTRWDRDGFDGEFGRRAWHELLLDDARSLFHRLMDRDAPSDWIDFGRMFLIRGDASDDAEAAFRRAILIDAECAPAIDAARADAAARLADRRAEDDRVAAQRLNTASPEAKDWPADPWPELAPHERQAARLAMLADADTLLDRAQLSIEPVESDFFILYWSGDRREAATWAVSWLDATYRDLAAILGVDPTTNLFWGKAVVFIFETEDQFRLVEAQVFNQFVPRGQAAMAHYEGPKAFIAAHRRKDDVMFRADLAREVAHVVMHRFVSPRRLPPWAHEGLAEYMAQQVIDESPIHEGLRDEALRLVRGGLPTREWLAMDWRDGSWRGREERGYEVCHLVVDYLINVSGGSFAGFTRSCKSGTAWQEAFATHFGGDVAAFLDAFTRFYRVND